MQTLPSSVTMMNFKSDIPGDLHATFREILKSSTVPYPKPGVTAYKLPSDFFQIHLIMSFHLYLGLMSGFYHLGLLI
jgi:hypothetical protein